MRFASPEWKTKFLDIKTEAQRRAETNGQNGKYVFQIVDFAEKWATAIDDRIAEGKTLEDVAIETSHEVDDTYGTLSVTFQMLFRAAKLMSIFWERGEQFQQWWNSYFAPGNVQQPFKDGLWNISEIITKDNSGKEVTGIVIGAWCDFKGMHPIEIRRRAAKALYGPEFEPHDYQPN